MHANILQQRKVWFSQMQTTPAALLGNPTITEELVLLVIASVIGWGLKLNTENEVSSVQLCQSLMLAGLCRRIL
jgi:hypothetical protein